MTRLLTTPAMVDAAQDAYDIAAADEQVAHVKYQQEPTEATYAKWLIASRARTYARAVLLSTMEDLAA